MNTSKPSISAGRRAAIYVRVSSEHQGEKASPDEQEADCRKLAEERDLIVVGTYRDIEKYRVKKRLVEPSATRTDRPGLLAMLRDGQAGVFDVIIAWKEDRLYRGLRPMLFVLEEIQANRLDVLLARETFDIKMAPIKAWVAGMELESMKERMTMGVKARLKAGKANCGQDSYGYRRNGEVYEIVAEEAKWIQQIYAWYNDNVPIMEIRRRLIEANAPQKGSSVNRKTRWARSSIQAVFKQAVLYATGIKIYRRAGEPFELRVPVIIDQATYEQYLSLRKLNQTHQLHPVKRNYLLKGLVHCTCDRRWQVRANSYTRRNRGGLKVPRKTVYPTYYCPQYHLDLVHSECPRTVGGKFADEFVWSKVREVLDNPDLLIGKARQYIGELQDHAANHEADVERLEKELETILTERQWVITQARKGRISDDDMDTQLAALSVQEAGIKRELASCQQTIDLKAIEGWEEKVGEYLADLRAGLEWLTVPPQNDEEALKQYEERRWVVQILVERVNISKDRELKVVFKLDVLAILNRLAEISEPMKVGIYTRTPTSHGRRLRAGGG